jgi:hypothetical protein
MELPITREQLQCYKDDYHIIARKKRLNEIINDISLKIHQEILGGRTQNKRFKYNIPNLYYYWGNSSATMNFIAIEDLVKVLKEKFIGCTIQTDPLDTYILIDWS